MAEEKTPLKWKFETKNYFKSSPIVSQGVVYFGSKDNHFYAGESTPGHGYSLPSLDIQVKVGDDNYETFNIEDEISEMEENDVDVSDAEAVLKYLKETYNL